MSPNITTVEYFDHCRITTLFGLCSVQFMYHYVIDNIASTQYSPVHKTLHPKIIL